MVAAALLLVGSGLPVTKNADAAPPTETALDTTGHGRFGKPGQGVDPRVPLKSAQAGKSIDDGEWEHEESERCRRAVAGTRAGALALCARPAFGCNGWVPTALESDELGHQRSGNASEAHRPNDLKGANADWYVVNSVSTAPSDLVAITDGGVERKGSRG